MDPELPTPPPEVTLISPDKLKALKPAETAYLSLALCGKLLAQGQEILKTPDQDRQEAVYLKR